MSLSQLGNPAAIWKPLIVCPQPEIARRIVATMAEIGCAAERVTEYPRLRTGAEAAARVGANICFLDVATNSEHAQVLIGELAPVMPVVALHHRNDADLILRCLRRGACEYLADPTAEAVRSLFERLARNRPDKPASAGGTVYCVIPGKPGCGASTLAVNLAIHLRDSGAARVLLVDADPMTASIAFMLQLNPQFHLGDVAQDWKRMDDDLWSRLTVPVAGLDVLAAPEDISARSSMNREFAAELCAFWRERYDAVVIDLADAPAAADCGLADLADIVLVVTTNELAAMRGTQRGLRYLERSLSDASKIRLIVNRYMSDTGLRRNDVRAALSVEPYAVLSNDYEAIQSALLEGRPIAANSRFAQSVAALCRQLWHPEAPARKAGSSWLPAWLSRGKSEPLSQNREPAKQFR